jgi:copper chaperone
MALQLKVSSIVCSGCAQTITKAVQSLDAEAKVEVDLEAKTVTIKGKPSEESLKQAIAATGHTVE